MDRTKLSKLISINRLYIILLNTLACLIIAIIFIADSSIEKIMSYPQGIIFLKVDTPENKINELIEKLKSERNINKYNYNTQERERTEFFKYIDNSDLQNSSLSSLIPASIEITLNEFNNLESLRLKIKSYEQVEDVKFINSNIENIKRFVNLFKIFSTILLVVISAITVLKIWALYIEGKNSRSKFGINNLYLIAISLFIYILIMWPVTTSSISMGILNNNKILNLTIITVLYSAVTFTISNLLMSINKKKQISSILNN